MADLETTINNTRDNSVDAANLILEQLTLVNEQLVEALELDATRRISYSTLLDPDFDGDESFSAQDLPLPERPNFVDIAVPSFASMPGFEALPIPAEVEFLPFADIAPSLPTVGGSATEGIDAPTFAGLDTVAVPDAPDLEEFEFPDLSAIGLDLPAMPTLPEISEYSRSLPDFDFEAPAPVLVYSEGEYESALKDAAEAWIHGIIVNGGTGLHPDVETAIWDRATSREVAKAHQALESTVDEFALANFPMPPGALQASLRKVRSNLQDRLDDLNRDISIEQARMAKTATEFAISKSLELEAIMIQHFDRVADRALQVARASVDLAIAVFNARVAGYNARLAAYKAGAEVEELKVRIALAAIENYRALLESKRVLGDLRKQEVDLYIAKLNSQQLLVERYKAMISAAATLGELEKLKIDEFRTRVGVMEAELRKAEVDISLRNSQLTGFKTEVDAYAVKADVVKSQNQVRSDKLRNEITRLQGLIDIQKARMQAVIEENRNITAKISAQTEVNRGKAVVYQADADVYRARIAAAQAAVQSELGKWQLIMEVRRGNIAEKNTTFRKEGDIYQAITQSKIAASQSAANAMATAAAAALSQITAIAQGVTTQDITA